MTTTQEVEATTALRRILTALRSLADDHAAGHLTDAEYSVYRDRVLCR